MLDYIRIACAIPVIQVGNCEANVVSICKLIQKAEESKCDRAVFPELCLTGYTCGDLFFQCNLQQAVMGGIAAIVQATQQFPAVTVAVGAPLLLQGRLYNCAVLISDGCVRGIVPKTYLPNHRSFQEQRWFCSAFDLRCTHIAPQSLGLDQKEDIPVGNDLIFRLGDNALLAVELCEDLFAPVSPSALLTSQGAEVVLNLAANPASVDKWETCRRLVANQSDTCRCIYGSVSSGCLESNQDMIFAGQCIIAENGKVLAVNDNELPLEDFLICDADLGKVRAERMRSVTVYPTDKTARIVDCSGSALRGDGSACPVNCHPFFTGREDAARIFRMQATALALRLNQLKTRPVVGVSGGLDSTLALMVAVEACKLLGRSPADVVGITMPCFGTSDRTYKNAQKLMEILGVTAVEIPVGEAVRQHFADIGHDPEAKDTTYENAQARERTQVLMDYAGKVGGIVVGTGDMSELALGWCTYNGDHMSMYSVNAGIPKTLIPEVIQSVMDRWHFRDAIPVLQDVINTPISPELLPPDGEGKIAQQTQDLVGPYELHDFFLYYVLHYGFTPEKIFALACRAFAETLDKGTVKKWMKVFYKRFFSQQFKRSCLPEGVQVLDISFSPRLGWQMPSDASARLWLDQIEKL